MTQPNGLQNPLDSLDDSNSERRAQIDENPRVYLTAREFLSRSPSVTPSDRNRAMHFLIHRAEELIPMSTHRLPQPHHVERDHLRWISDTVLTSRATEYLTRYVLAYRGYAIDRMMEAGVHETMLQEAMQQAAKQVAELVIHLVELDSQDRLPEAQARAIEAPRGSAPSASPRNHRSVQNERRAAEAQSDNATDEGSSETDDEGTDELNRTIPPSTTNSPQGYSALVMTSDYQWLTIILDWTRRITDSYKTATNFWLRPRSPPNPAQTRREDNLTATALSTRSRTGKKPPRSSTPDVRRPFESQAPNRGCHKDVCQAPILSPILFSPPIV